MVIGTSAQNAQRFQAKLAVEQGKKPPVRLIPAGKATAAAIAGLAVASVIVHMQFGGVI
jgi:hypothetical protein